MIVKNIAGYTVILIPSNSPVSSVRVLINAGSNQEIQQGTAHFLEHMFFKGTETQSASELNRLMASIGDSNAYTGRDNTVYFINTTPRHTLKALEILCEMMFNPALKEEDIDQERGVILEEWQTGQDDPMHCFMNNSSLELFGEQAGHNIVGTKESIEGITRDHLIDFRKNHYTRANIAFVIAGDGLDDKEIERVLSAYGDTPQGVENKYLSYKTPFGKWGKPKTVRFDHESSQAWIGLWTPGVNALENIALGYAADVMQDILGGGMHSLLFDRVREQLGLAYAVGSTGIPNGLSCPFVCYAMTSKENVKRVIKEMQRTVEQVSRGEFSKELLETSINHYEYMLASSVQTVGGLAAYANDYFLVKDVCGSHLLPGGGATELEYGYSYHSARYFASRDKMADLIPQVAAKMLEGSTLTIMNG